VNVNATTLAGVFATTLLAQALLPSMRLVIVLSGAALSVLATTALRVGTAPQVLADVPYGVLLILAGLGLLAEMLGEGPGLRPPRGARRARYGGAPPAPAPRVLRADVRRLGAGEQPHGAGAGAAR
jgi:hypothetical protein